MGHKDRMQGDIISTKDYGGLNAMKAVERIISDLIDQVRSVARCEGSSPKRKQTC